jgi:hypothetical protein
VKETVIHPYSLYYGVAILLLACAVLTELFHVSAAVILCMFALLSALYGMELHRDFTQQSYARKVSLWFTALVISALIFAPLIQ